MSKLFVGSLPYSTTSADLEQLFATHGAVQSANVVTDRETGRSKGFGFVEFSSETDAKAAIQALNGHELNGRQIVVSEARPQTEKRSGGFRGGRDEDRRSRW